MNLQLVPEARKAWRWFSVQAFTLAASIQGVWVALPDDIKARMPTDFVFYVTVAVCVLGVVGRVVVQNDTPTDTENK